jgi:hypothetical protein
VARHRYTVNAPGASPVVYATRRAANAVARQVQGATVTPGAPGGGCLVALLVMLALASLPTYVVLGVVAR